MNKSIKKEWIKKLRSGKFTQAEDVLKAGKGRYCCLGVLNTCLPRGFQTAYADEEGEAVSELSNVSLKAAGLKNDTQQRLINMNDAMNDFDKHSFEEISNYIEKRL